MSFTIFVKEENQKLPVSIGRLEGIARFAFSITGREQGDISLVACDDPFIADLNLKYMNSSGPTDVLAFPMREGKSLPNQGSAVGDIVISIDTAKRQAMELGTTLQQEFVVLFIHGLLHLLGYDHRTKYGRRKMEEITSKIFTGVQQIR